MVAFLKAIEPSIRDLLGLRRRRFRYYSADGKGNLMKKCSLVIRTHMAESPGHQFVILCDQDTEECTALKARFVRLVKLHGATGRCRVRIVCRELEAWLLGDRVAFEAAFPGSGIARNIHDNPDGVLDPKRLVCRATRSFPVTQVAARVGRKMDSDSIKRNHSTSFQCFLSGLARLCGQHRQFPRNHPR